jgi:hypothetical protein
MVPYETRDFAMALGRAGPTFPCRKRGYLTKQRAADIALVVTARDLERGIPRPPEMIVYQCQRCLKWHISRLWLPASKPCAHDVQ